MREEDTGVSERLDTAKERLDDCRNNHPLCRTSKAHEPPTRLVRIDGLAAKLVLTTNMTTTPPYATLSYCWGLEPFTMLTEATLDSFFEDIPIHTLPQTFKDAIQITKAFGLSHVWIDALCIIQQDESDWSREAGRMWSVYGGSQINIAASSASDAHGGCLFHTEQTGFRARTPTSDRYVLRGFYLRGCYEETVDKSALATRSWAFQEKVLAPRTVHCGDKGFTWECRTHTLLENSGPITRHVLDESLRQLIVPESEPWEWDLVIRNYSKTNSTHDSDRLPALSGIASRQFEAQPYNYLAGMWRDGLLIAQLLWHTYPPNKRSRQTVPTWSWASVNSPVATFPFSGGGKSYMMRYRTIRILDVWTKLSNPDPFGAVDGGELTLGCAALLRGCLRTDSRAEIPLEPEAPEVLPHRPKATVWFARDRTDDCGEEETVYFLTVLNMDDGWLKRAYGIVLQRCGDERGYFRRIGYFWTDYELHRDKYLALNRMMSDMGPEVARTECFQIQSSSDGSETPYIIVIR